MSDTLTDPATGTPAAHEDPIYVRCQRWRTHLTAHSEAFRELGLERARGWQSPALDAWYAGHRAGGGGSGAPPNQPSPVRPSVDTIEDGAQAPRTSFAEADTTLLAERYRAHCRRLLPAADRALFAPGRTAVARTFLDLGCAPGGVSKYLVKDLAWSGVGLTLPASMGGIDVDAELRRTAATPPAPHGPTFELWEGDVAQSPMTWRLTAPVGSRGWQGGRRFCFVNGGAVQDHGQRLLQERQEQQQEQQPQSPAHPGLQARESAGEGDVGTVAGAGSGDGAAILPWFTLFVPQLRVALQHVEEGGSVMLVYGAPHCASLCILLVALEFLYGSDAASLQDRVAVLETMHLVKPPVYVLLRGLHPAREPGRVQRLLQSLDPLSDVLSPIPAAGGAPSPLQALDAQGRRLAKQHFWLGESDEGFALAETGLRRYGALLDAVWGRARGCLLGRRLRAERALAVKAVSSSGEADGHRSGAGRGQGSWGKRQRSE